MKHIIIKLILTIPALIIGIIKGVILMFHPVYDLWNDYE